MRAQPPAMASLPGPVITACTSVTPVASVQTVLRNPRRGVAWRSDSLERFGTLELELNFKRLTPRKSQVRPRPGAREGVRACEPFSSSVAQFDV